MTNLITSQDFLDSEVVAQKVKACDFDVFVSPEFTFEGETYRVLLDGHHSLAAAAVAGVEPSVTEYDHTDHDAVYVLENEGPDAFLEVVWMGHDWIFADTRRPVWA